MTLSYQLDHHDFLQHQLFLASKTDRIKKKRIRSWLIVSGTMFLLGFLFYQSNNSFFSYYFLGMGVVTLIFYPLYQRQQYKNHYAKFISETYKGRFGQSANVHFGKNGIETSDVTGESRISLAELDKVTETSQYFYLGLRSGGNLIIPKAKVGEVSELRHELKQLCETLAIRFIEDLTWKWK